MNFDVSVIIPVFNVSEYVEQAVQSASDIEIVKEIILIEDGSTDDSLRICMNLANKNRKVKVAQHSDQRNRGISASRNLGLSLATCPFVSFLDADDWYLPHRFEKDKELFLKNKDIDAVYSCVILESELKNSGKVYGINFNPQKYASNNELYKWFIESKKVLFHTNSITLKKDFLINGKAFDDRLAIHEDTELWLRLLRRGIFHVGSWERPVAVIRRHAKNNITKRNWKTVLKMYEVSVSNIGIGNMYDFEIDYFYTGIIRLKSKKFKADYSRRLFFYWTYFWNSFHKIKYLKKTVLN